MRHRRVRNEVLPFFSSSSASSQLVCRRPRVRYLVGVLDRFADFKMVTIQTSEGGASASELEKYGTVVEHTSGTVKLKVKRERVIPVCKALLDELPVTDIDIQEVPIEDIIRQLFAREPGAPKL